jgi:hypothetical protein
MKKTAFLNLMSDFGDDYLLYTSFIGGYVKHTHNQFNFNLFTSEVSIAKYANGQVSFAMSNVCVTDDQPRVIPVFDHVKTGNADTIFDLGEVWKFITSGVAVDLSTPPAGVTVVQGECTHDQTQPARIAYINQVNPNREGSLR